jgi:energy-coupling factor transport system permease protein
MANNTMLINFKPSHTFLGRLNGSTKVPLFVAVLIMVLMSFDMRILAPVLLSSVIGLISLKPNKTIVKASMIFFVVLNLLNIFLFWLVDPDVGSFYLGGDRTPIGQIFGYVLTQESVWYLGVRFFKIFTSFMISLVFIFSITPSQLASGLASMKVPPKIAAIISLTFRFIPDLANDFTNMKISLQARGLELDAKKISPMERLKRNITLLIPFLLTSFNRVEVVANALDLRGFGHQKKRSYYVEQPPTISDKLMKGMTWLVVFFVLGYLIYMNTIATTQDMWAYWK